MYKYMVYFFVLLNFPFAQAQLSDEFIQQLRDYQTAATTKDNIGYKYKYINIFSSIYCCSTAENKQLVNQALDITAEKVLAQIEQWALETQDAKIYFEVGSFYDFELGTGDMETSEAKRTALKWWEKAANAGNSTAQNNLAIIYKDESSSRTYGVTKNIVTSIDWMERAVKSGDIDAVRNLAELYLKGELVPQDTQKALSIYKKSLSSDNNLGPVLEDLIKIYTEGLYGVKKDCQLAEQYVEKIRVNKYYPPGHTQTLSDEVSKCSEHP